MFFAVGHTLNHDKILSGPEKMARATVAKVNAVKISKFILPYPKVDRNKNLSIVILLLNNLGQLHKK